MTFGKQGTVLSMAYMPMVSKLAPPTCDGLEYDDSLEFSTKVDYQVDHIGMPLKTVLPSVKPPPGLNYLPGTKSTTGSGTGAGAGGGGGFAKDEPEPPQGLFGYLTKYWYIVVPLMLMNLLGPEPPREGEEGGGGGQPSSGATPPPAAAAAAAPAARASPPTKQRRGKRG